MLRDILDNPLAMSKRDRRNLRGSLVALPDQVRQAFAETLKLKFPASYRKVKQIVIGGMGGSALAGRVLASLLSDALKIPIAINDTADVPKYVGRDTLYIFSSYSGSTAEVLATLQPVTRTLAKRSGITANANSPLGKWLTARRIPGYLYTPTFNPSGQPRMSLGYGLTGLMGILSRLGFMRLTSADVERACRAMLRVEAQSDIAVTTARNPVKRVARSLGSKSLAVVGFGFLTGSVHALANQLNENAKRFAAPFALPELNHHLLESIRTPKDLSEHLAFVLVRSVREPQFIRTRYDALKELLEDYGIRFEELNLSGGSNLVQVYELLALGGYLSYYLALQSGIDPTPVPTVDWLKKRTG